MLQLPLGICNWLQIIVYLGFSRCITSNSATHAHVHTYIHTCAVIPVDDSLGCVGYQIGDLFEALGQSMNVGRDEITRFQVRFCMYIIYMLFIPGSEI